MSALDPVQIAARDKPGGSINSGGYRTFWIDGQNRYEHRLIWKRLFGPIPKGMIVHHRDENPLNNEPHNLELVDARTHRRMHSRNYKLVNGVWLKQCIACVAILPLTEFYSVKSKNKRNGKSYEGLSSRCKPCERIAARNR